jgi:hypothetical protein
MYFIFHIQTGCVSYGIFSDGCLLFLLNDGLHGREKKNFLDVDIVRNEHDKSVDTDTTTTSRRQSVLEAITEIFIVSHSFIVSLLLVLNLLDEDLALLEGIVQLSESVSEFVVVDEELESLSHIGLSAVILSKRRHDLRMFHDEGRILAVNF